MRTAVFVLSDPASNTDEALGRLLNALSTVWDFRDHGDDVRLVFLGPGTRWPAVLELPEHPAHDVWTRVSDCLAGASRACADAFGATADLERVGVALRDEVKLPGTAGVASVRAFVSEGWNVLVF